MNRFKGAALLAALWLYLVPVFGAPQDGDDELSLSSRLVNIDVIARDSKGNFVTDLTAADFAVTENGVAQHVEFFDPPATAPAGKATSPEVASGVPAGEPRNIVSLVLDGQTTEQVNLKQLREGTVEYVRTRITPADTVAVFRIANGLQLLQPFTSDKAKLLAAVDSGFSVNAGALVAEGRSVAGQVATQESILANATQTQTPATAGNTQPDVTAQRQAQAASRALEQFYKLRSQLSLQQSRPVLAALAAICEAQRVIPGKKIVVLFSQGFVTGSTQDWQVQSAIDLANRANVAIYVIDSAGLREGGAGSGEIVPSSPLDSISGLNSGESRIRAVGGENVFDRARYAGVERGADILYRLSGDTGGAFIKNTNDISVGLDRIDKEMRARYTLGYYSTDSKTDGSFRKVKIEIRRPGVKVAARSGYYAIGNDEVVALSVDEKKLIANVASLEKEAALPMSVDLSPFRSSDGFYVVPLSIEIPPSAVKFDRKGDVRSMHLEVVGVVREGQDRILSRLGGTFDVSLSDEQYANVVKNKIFYRQDVELPPGSYGVDFVVRDKLSGKVAGKAGKLVLPETDTAFASSGIVLSRLALPTTEQAAAADILSEKNVQIRPSPSREFLATDNLIIFFDLYNAALRPEMNKPQVRVTVTISKDGKNAMRPIDYLLTETSPSPVPHLTFAKFVSLAGLAPGAYLATIEIRDVPGNATVTRREPFAVVQ